jgi:hypothetical protein
MSEYNLCQLSHSAVCPSSGAKKPFDVDNQIKLTSKMSRAYKVETKEPRKVLEGFIREFQYELDGKDHVPDELGYMVHDDALILYTLHGLESTLHLKLLGFLRRYVLQTRMKDPIVMKAVYVDYYKGFKPNLGMFENLIDWRHDIYSFKFHDYYTQVNKETRNTVFGLRCP